MKGVLPVIVVSQFFCTSVWFAVNAVMPELVKNLQLTNGFLAHFTSVVQFGFITGTLIFAILTIADRLQPTLVFFISAIIAAAFNLMLVFDGIPVSGLLISRFLTGFFLAGIYPVGMKIASDHFQKGLGRSLGFLVGALVLGTAFPHLLKSASFGLSWKYVVYATSALSVSGGLLMLFLVPDGPYRKPLQDFNLSAFLKVFANTKFRSASFGYFGHMWELYAFWAFVPLMLTAYKNYFNYDINVSFLSFLIIASGSLACVFSGLIAQKFGPKKVAATALFISGICCLLSPIFLLHNSLSLLLLFLFIWGIAVIADSPLFSTMVAQNAAEESRGTSLTIVNCIGFSITIFSIQLLNFLTGVMNFRYIFLWLAIGPALGLWALLRKTYAN